MKIPCKGCLVLPMCQQKSGLECDMLHKWAKENKSKWHLLSEFLPSYPNIRINTPFKRNSKGVVTTKIIDIYMATRMRPTMQELNIIQK